MKSSTIVFSVVVLSVLASHGCQCQDDKKSTAVSTVTAPALPSNTTSATDAIVKKLSANPATACFTLQPTPFNVVTSLITLTVKEGTGNAAKKGDRVIVQYSSYLTDCTLVETSRTGGQPFSYVLGEGKQIKGWDEGITGMKVGGHRHLVIPTDLAYGEKGLPPKIPPHAVILLEVELLDVKSSH